MYMETPPPFFFLWCWFLARGKESLDFGCVEKCLGFDCVVWILGRNVYQVMLVLNC